MVSSAKIVYLANYKSQDIVKSRGLKGYSLAGNSKQEGIVKCIERAGMKVTVLSPACYNNRSFRFHKLEKARISSSDVIYLPFISVPYMNLISSNVFALIYLCSMVWRGQINRILFYNHGPRVSIPAILMKILFGIPVYVEYEDSYYRGNKNPLKKGYGFCLEKAVNKIVDGAILVNSLLIDEIQTENFMICRGFTTELKHERNRDPDYKEVWIAYTGGLDNIRGIDTFVNGVLKLPDEIDGKKIRIFITGDGPLKKWMLDMIGKAENIEYLGILERDEYERLIVNADILVNPHKEGVNDLFPSKIFEYISTGNIIVSSNCSDISLLRCRNLFIYENYSLDDLLYRVIKEQPKAVKDAESMLEYSVDNTARRMKRIFSIYGDMRLKKNAGFSRESAEHNYTSSGNKVISNKKMSRGRIHLLYLITEYDVGGAEKAMVRILSRIDKSKYNITVAALRRGRGRLLPELEKTGVRIETVGVKSRYDFVRSTFHLYCLIKELGVQVLVCSLSAPTVLGRLMGRLAGVPVIINWEHSENLGGTPWLLLNKATSHLSDKVICDSRKVATELMEHLHIAGNLVKVIPIGGVDLPEYRFEERSICENIEVGTIGSLTAPKGHNYLIEAARIVLEKMDNVNFSIVGDGRRLDEFRQLVEDLSLSGKVKLLGFRSDIPQILSKWDIYVQPSLWEGLCITVVEAMASGLPIVATRVGGIPESVIDGHNGFLVPPENPEALASKILELAENPDLRARMGRRGRKIAEEKYSLGKMVKGIEEVIDSLIEKKMGLMWYQGTRHYWMRNRSL